MTPDNNKPSTPAHALGAPESELFHMFAESVVDYAVFVLDTHGIISSWNQGAQRIKGYTADEIIGRHFSVFYTQESRDQGWPDEELRRAAAQGRFEDEGWRVRKDGSQFWANVVISALRDTSGRLVGFSKITRDLTERRQQEQQLRESEESFRLLVEGIKDQSIFLLDPEGRIVSWNAGAERVHGYQAAEVLGRCWSMFHPPEEVAVGKADRALEIASTAGVVTQNGWRVRRDGTRFWAEVTLTALRHRDGSLRGFAEITRDRSERRRLKRLETEGKRINEFIAMLGHELRNPLAPIRNAVGIIARKADSPELLWCKDLIARQLDQLTRIVDDLLDVSRITSGKMQLEKEPLDLKSIVAAAAESMQPTLAGLDHTLALQLPDGPVPALGDATRLSQVVVNLLNNAGKYTPGGGRIEVILEATDEQAQIRVRDNGVGMSRELIERVFDLFEQGDRSLDRSEGGLGIGLMLVKRIVMLHGGNVVAHSAGLGQGSEFVVTLPVVAQLSGSAPAPAAPAAARGGRRILVVDDNADAADSLAQLLTLSGHDAMVAHSAAEALRIAADAVPDLIALDIGLPEMDGYEVARRLRAMPALAQTRLVAITGYGQPRDKELALQAGFETHLVKPVDYMALLDLIGAAR